MAQPSAETLISTWSLCFSVGIGNVLETHRQQQVLALGRLGWSLRHIERETGVRRETASDYLKAAEILVWGRGRPNEGKGKPAISRQVFTDASPPPWPPPRHGPRKPVRVNGIATASKPR
jgi:hypothetical protein